MLQLTLNTWNHVTTLTTIPIIVIPALALIQTLTVTQTPIIIRILTITQALIQTLTITQALIQTLIVTQVLVIIQILTTTQTLTVI